MLASIVNLNKPKGLIGLGQKARSRVRGLRFTPARTPTLPVYRANLNHPVNIAEHGNTASPARSATGLTSPQGGSGGAVLGRPKKPKPAVMRWICPRRSGQSWQENLQNHQNRKQQMTVEQSTDALSLRKGFDGCERILPRQQLLVAAVGLDVPAVGVA